MVFRKKPTITNYILLRPAGKVKFLMGITLYTILYIYQKYYILYFDKFRSLRSFFDNAPISFKNRK